MQKLDDGLLWGYIEQTLTPEEKKLVEARVQDSAELSSRLAELRLADQHLRQQIKQEIGQQPVPVTLRFSTISAEVARRRPAPQETLSRWLSSFVGLAALFVLITAFIFSLNQQESHRQEGALPLSTPTTTIPALFTTTMTTTQTISPTANPLNPPTILTRTPIPTDVPAQDGVLSFPESPLWSTVPTRQP